MLIFVTAASASAGTNPGGRQFSIEGLSLAGGFALGIFTASIGAKDLLG
jgi:hypothetical protein